MINFVQTGIATKEAECYYFLDNENKLHPIKPKELPKKYTIYFYDEDQTIWANHSSIVNAEIAAHKINPKIDCIIYDDAFTKNNPVSQRINGVWK